MSGDPTRYVDFDFQELSAATNGFDNRPVSIGGCKLWEEEFGPVFQGELKFTDVVIKVMRNTKGSKAERLAMEVYETEVKVLSKFRHPNLVTLIGYCNSPNNPKCLVYELMPNGSLEDALEIGLQDSSSTQHRNKGIHLPWMCRLSIATDIARGLAYLHTADKKDCVIHRDVKSASVLLDLSFRAKLCNLGLARPLDKDARSEARTARVVGTSGYIPPEYYRGIITTKMDAFAFGVILLELITGLPSYDPRRIPKDLISYMEHYMDLGLSSVLCTKVDVHAGDWPSQSFLGLFRIADDCVKPKITQRAEVAEVYPKLKKLMADSTEWYSQQEKYVTKRTAT